ncbi:HK97 family phage prohead protease [Clostridium sp.]|uniref:HK97 family phage prohead protease n=1 Tax=Clostridium sp. TaxID=1506 RepID=UPI0025BF574C|nr:HK97 family phage prohead protease [Clostridium sp.]
MNKIKLEGYVNSVARDSKLISENGKTFVEQIAPGVWEKALKKNKDIKILLNHDKTRELGSILKGNLELLEDNIGLKVKCLIDDPEVIQYSKDNKLKGWSFGFSVIKDRWEKIDAVRYRRIIEDLELYEVSILTVSPAYYGTSIEERGSNIIMEYRSIANNTELHNKKNIFDILNDFIIDNKQKVEIDNIKLSNETIIENSKLINIVNEYGNLTDDRYGYIGKVSIDTKTNNIVVTGVDKIESEKEIVLLKNIPELLVEANGPKLIETLLKMELIQKVHLRIKNMLDKEIIKVKTVSNVTDFIDSIESVPKPLRKGMVLVGNTLDLAKIKLRFAKEGLTDLLGIYPIEVEELESMYLINIQCLFINSHIRKVEYRKNWDVYDFKVVLESMEGLGNKKAGIKVELV